ncbi:hypothetical protein Ahy_A04g021597 isoform A [Arachis hypogaea]|uniref:Uncharacterized protein n=1 Tax=Arachis hypogaea TaxID=3818 RepID=A0A445DKV1_ARAHY|nr:hypothetical protein Ahy_A04g021597 isoform A [Arachis hypogaea]
MPLSVLHITFASPIQQSIIFHTLTPSTLLPKTLFPPSISLRRFNTSLFPTINSNKTKTAPSRASLIETPVLWLGRLCIFYALLKAGLAGSHANPLVSDLEISDGNDSADLGFSKWTQTILGKPESNGGSLRFSILASPSFIRHTMIPSHFFVREAAKEGVNGRKFVSKWHPTTKGTLRRNYRVPSKFEGRRLLKAIASLLSEDDHFVDATSHKGCQIRRESAHGESVCCNNVRALFDELPTPHLTVEITPFPAGPLTDTDYNKAEKLERVLRSSPSV